MCVTVHATDACICSPNKAAPRRMRNMAATGAPSDTAASAASARLATFSASSSCPCRGLHVHDLVNLSSI